MPQYAMEIDNELRVVENELYRGLGVRKSLRAPSDALKGIAGALKEFRDNTDHLLSGLMEELDRQEMEIDQQIGHNIWWLNELKNYTWGHNQMLDRKRLTYIDQIHNLKRERRGIRTEKFKEKRAFLKDLLDANRELSPFLKLF